MALKVGDVFTGSRALLNDQAGAVYTNEVQFEYFKLAYEEIGQECEDSNIPITNKTTDAILISQGITDIGGLTGPALPNDLVEPLDLWEITYGTTGQYMLMKRVQFLPKTDVLTSYLEVWAWKEDFIHFLGANGDINVKMDYISIGMPDVVNENSIIKMRNAVNFLKYKTAALCSMFIDENETRATVCNDLAIKAFDTFMGIKIKSQQNIVTRRRPFRASWKRSGYGGGY
jgi:hypothetical protein